MSKVTTPPSSAPATLAGVRLSWLHRRPDPSIWADWAAAIGLAVLVVIFAASTSTFLTSGNIQAVLLAAAIPITLAAGQTFVIATAGIDLSMASAMTFAAVVLGQAYAAGWSMAWCCLLAIATGAAVGLANGLIIAKGRVTDFIVTLGTLSAASAAALILSQGNSVTVTNRFLLRLATGSVGVIAYPVIVAAVIAIIAHIVIFHTRFGVHTFATGGAVESARAMGVSTDRVKIAVYTISGICAGIAAVLLVARIGAAEPATDTSYLLNAIAAVVLGGVSLFGGRGTIIGPLLGALLLTVLLNGLTLLSVSQFYQPLVVGVAVVLAALIMRFRK